MNGSLAVSRAFGDLHLKDWITCDPDIVTIPLTADCEFVIVASDGLWDKVLVFFVRIYLLFVSASQFWQLVLDIIAVSFSFLILFERVLAKSLSFWFLLSQ